MSAGRRMNVADRKRQTIHKGSGSANGVGYRDGLRRILMLQLDDEARSDHSVRMAEVSAGGRCC